MAYAHFVEEGNLGLEVCQILQIQVVARIEPEANFLAGDSSINKGLYCLLGVSEEVFSVGFGVQLHAIGPRLPGKRGKLALRINENRCSDAMLLKSTYDVGELA